MVGGKVPSKHLDELSSKSEREQVTVGGHLFPMSPPLTAVGLGTAENGPKPLGVDCSQRKTQSLEATARLPRAENPPG
jgi:hypothetical protein